MLPRITKSETVYTGRTLSLRLDEVELKPGQITRLEIVDHTGAVVIVPLDEAGQIWFVRQYRHAAREYLLELPAGTLGRHEEPEAGARRELQEEIGMYPGQLEHLQSFWLAPGYSTEYMHVYLARALTPSALPQDADEDIAIEKIPAARALALAATPGSELHDAKSLLGLLAAAAKIAS